MREKRKKHTNAPTFKPYKKSGWLRIESRILCYSLSDPKLTSCGPSNTDIYIYSYIIYIYILHLSWRWWRPCWRSTPPTTKLANNNIATTATTINRQKLLLLLLLLLFSGCAETRIRCIVNQTEQLAKRYCFQLASNCLGGARPHLPAALPHLMMTAADGPAAGSSCHRRADKPQACWPQAYSARPLKRHNSI